MSVDATIHERVCSHRAVLLDDQPIGVNSHPATLRLPGNTTLATPRSVVVTYDFGSLEHAVAARPAAVTAAHTPKSARRVAIDPYRLIVQQDSPVGANALVDGGVNGHRSKWSVANGLGGARPPDRSRALPTMRRGGDRLKTSVKHTANVHGDPVSVGRGTRWVCHRYWSNFRFRFWPRFGAKSR